MRRQTRYRCYAGFIPLPVIDAKLVALLDAGVNIDACIDKTFKEVMELPMPAGTEHMLIRQLRGARYIRERLRAEKVWHAR